MPKDKHRDFNPLDILATAAALQSGDNTTSESSESDMTQIKDVSVSKKKNGSSEKESNGSKPKVEVRKIKVLTVCSDIDKMFDEHNYGNSRRVSIKASGSCSPDVLANNKERKVIVTLVDKSGDHRVVKTFNSVKLSGDNSADKTSAGNADSPSENLVTKAKQSIKISCGEKLVNNSVLVQTANAGDNSIIPQVNKDSLDQVKLFTTETQVNSDKTEPQDIAECTGNDGLINTTSTCQERVVQNDTCTACDEQKVDTLVGQNPGQVLDSEADGSVRNMGQKLKVNTDVNTFDIQTKTREREIRLCEKSAENTETNDVDEVALTNASKCRVDNIDPKHNPETLELDRDQGIVFTKPCDDVAANGILANVANAGDSKSISILAGANSVDDSTLSHDAEINMRQTAEGGESSADMIPGPKESGENNVFKLDLGGVGSPCDCGHSSDGMMSPLGKYCGSMECASCFKGLGDSDNWHYEGESGRSDVRLSIDLDSPKSEKHDIKYESKMTSKSNTSADESVNDNPTIGANCSNNLTSHTDISTGKEDRPCHFDDHCYAGVSSSQTRMSSVSNSEDEPHTESNSDLSQDSGFGEVGHSPGTQEIHVDVCGLEESTRKSGLTIGGKPVYLADSSLLPLLQMKCSGKGGLPGLSEINKTRDAIIALVQSSDSAVFQNARHSQISPVASISPPKKDTSPRFGKYRIGTFASVSNSAMGLESPKKLNIHAKNTTSNPRNATSLLANHPLMALQGKSRDLDRKNYQTSYQGQSRNQWKSHVEHDHDYCQMPEQETVSAKSVKESGTRHSTRTKEKRSENSEKKSKKVAIIEDEKLDFEDSMDSFSFDESSQPSSPSVAYSQSARQQKVKASEKIAEYVKAGCSDSKLKITGSFQDDYIYFLNTKSRSRRSRTVSQDVPHPFPGGDRIVLPLPKAGDIVVPHLTDADLEAIKQGHPSAAKPMQRYPVTSIANTPTSVKSEGTAVPSMTKHQSFSDEESKIINTILSMENGEPSSQSSVEAPGLFESGLLSGTTGDGLLSNINLTPELSNINLTPEQMEILYHAMDEVQSLSPDVSSAGNKFDIDSGLTTPISSGTTPEDDASKTAASEDPAVPVTTAPEETISDSPVPVTSSSSDSVTVSLDEKTPASDSTSERSTSAPISTNVTTAPGPGVVNSLPDIPFPSLDKSSLDIFGNDLKLFPEASVETPTPPLATDSNSSAVTSFNNSDNSAPWIVTVSMYWNDLPAIMINKLPYVRLVDIHKQILPAKDTGILKKRCQLLGIPVLNCTEMQRYFLVQYGKAFNSKSTLIIGKDNATSLIGYYVNPVPAPNKGREGRTIEKPVDLEKEARSLTGKPIKWSPMLKQRLESNDNGPTKPVKESVVVHDEVDSVRKAPPPVEKPAVPAVAPAHFATSQAQSVTSVSSEPPKITSRTRHKKINFLEMLKGDSNNNTSSEATETDEVSPLQSTKPEKPIKTERAKGRKTSPDTKDKSRVNNSDHRPKAEKANKHRNSVDETVQVEMTCDSESENLATCSKRKLRVHSEGEGSPKSKRPTVDKPKTTTPLKVKWAMFNKKNSKKTDSGDASKEGKEILAVVHKDMTPKNGQRGRIQAGNVFIDMYDGPNNPCVRCCTCKKLYSVDNFLKHLHEIGGNGKLLVVTQPQTFALRDTYPSENQKRLWGSFQKRRRMYSAELSAKNGVKMDVKKNVEIDESIVTKIQSSLMKDRNVRISARKRKPKQLHPIENYSFSKSAASNQAEAEDVEPACDEHIAVELPPPTKISRIMPNLSAGIQSLARGSSEEPGTGSSTVASESVVAIANGPEVISFTALENGFDV